MKKLKIAIIGVKGLPAFGGAARSVEELVKSISKFYDFTLIEIDSHADKNYLIEGVSRVILPTLKAKRFSTLAYYFLSLFYCLFFNKFDLVITNHLYCGFIIPFLRLRYKVINIVHGIIPITDNKWNKFDKFIFRSFEWFAVKFSSQIVSVSRAHLTYLKSIGAIDPIFIPNGIDLQNSIDFRKEVKSDYLTFAAARVISLKGCHTLLEALSISKIMVPLKVIGDIEQVTNYKKKLISLAHGLDVEFIGLIKDKNKLFHLIANSKIFVFPSFNEGMSNMLLEVASLGTPIICSDIVENKAVFTDSDVLFFKVGDSVDLSEKILFAINNYGEMLEKAKSASERLKNEYNWSIISNKYKDLINSLTEK